MPDNVFTHVDGKLDAYPSVDKGCCPQLPYANRAGLGRKAISVLLRTLGLAALGLALGMAASRALSNTLGSLLFGVTSGDPVTYVGVGALLIVIAAVSRTHSGLARLADRSNGCAAVELNHPFREISQRRR